MKRILSLILALSMLFSLLPAISANETQQDASNEMSGIKVTYNLAGYINNSALGAQVTNDGFKTIDYINSNGFFEFAASNYGGTAYSWLENENTYLTEKPNSGFVIEARGLKLVGKRTPWFALKIYVPKTGLYVPRVNYTKYNSSVEKYLDYFLIKVTDTPISEALAEMGLTTAHTGYIGSKRCDSETGATQNIDGESFDDKTIPLSEGEYYLVYYPRAHANGDYALAGNFTLDGGETAEAEPMLLKLSCDEKRLPDDGTANLSAMLYMSDGSSQVASDVSYEVTDDTKQFASVDRETGVISGIAPGTAKVVAKTTVKGKDFTAELSLPVVNSNLSGITVTYDLAGYLNDTTLGAQVANEGFKTIDYTNSKNFFEFAASNYGSTAYSWLDNEYTYLTEKPNSGFVVEPRGLQLVGQRNPWFALKIYVPKKGMYIPKVNYTRYNSTAEKYLDYFLIKVTDAPISEALAETELTTAHPGYIGSKRCDSETGTTQNISDESFDDKSLNLDVGDYYLVYYPRAHANGDYALAGNFTLDGGDKAVPMSIEISGEEVSDLDAIVYLSNGTTAKKVTYESENETIAKIDENGVITAFQNAIVDITVTAENDGYTISKTFSVNVKLPEIPGVLVTYDIASRVGGSNDTDVLFTDFTYETNNNLWEYAANRRSKYSWVENGANTTSTSGADLVYCREQGIAIRVRKNWWAIKIRVNEGGLYLPRVSYGTYQNYSPYQINGEYVYEEDGVTQKKVPVDVYLNYYLIPVTEQVGEDGVIPELNNDAFVKGNYLIGSVLCSDTSVDNMTMKQEILAKRIIEKGEYYFVYMPEFESPIDGASMVGNLRALAGNLTLDGVNNIKEAEITADTYDLTYYTPEFEAKAQINVAAKKLDGTVLTSEKLDVTYKSLNLDVAEVDKNGVVTGVGDGIANVEVTVSDGTAAVTDVLTFNVTDMTGVKDTSTNVDDKLYVREKKLVKWNAHMNSGNIVEIPLEGNEITIGNMRPSDVACIEDGMLRANAEGSFSISFGTTFRGQELFFEKDITVVLHEGKSEPTYFTNDMREAMRENIAKYDWAKDTRDKAAKAADKILGKIDVLYKQLHGEGIPRGRQVGVRGDDYAMYCRYCGAYVDGDYSWIFDYTARPWKVQCSACKRLFPTNDFESFYGLGRDGLGYFDVDRARQAHHEMLFHKEGEECTCEKPAEGTENTPEWYIFYGYGNPDGYLYNNLYEEIRKSNEDPRGKKITWNGEQGANLGEYRDENGKLLWRGGDMWGVDDGWGYLPGRTYTDELEERHGYISLYSYTFWGDIYGDIRDLADAYLYTGDLKYGRAAAIMLDKIVDVFPDFDVHKWNYPKRNMKFWVSGSGTFTGAIVGSINDSYLVRELLLSADILYPILDDAELIRTLAKKAEEFGNERNDKSSSEKIWQNWEERLVHTAAIMCQDGRVGGNFGQAQNVAAIAAIVLDKQPETDDILEWIYKTGEFPYPYTNRTGGDMATTLIDLVDRDGMGNEVSPRYNTSWISNLTNFHKALSHYNGDGNYNPFKNPKFAKMYEANANIVLTGNKHPTIGDAGSPATVAFNGGTTISLEGFKNIENESLKKKIAQYLYTLNGNKTEGLKYDIFTKNPESAEEDIEKYVDEDVSLESLMLTGYGFAALRDGKNYTSANGAEANNNHRDFWMFFGNTTAAHSHKDALNIGIDAFGLDIAPDLGYPEEASYTPNRKQWVSQTISHNTIVVDEQTQGQVDGIHGYPYHFDDSGKVKIMDADMKSVYPQTENYRRTIIMIEANDDVSYGVDFFRVTGGNKHTYSFHSQAENAYPISGIELTPQVDENGEWIGTYAGVDGKDPETGEWIDYGPDPWTEDAWDYETKYPRGYTWLNKIRRDRSPDAQFTVEFDVKDYRKVLKNGEGIKLRMTQLNNFTPDEVAITAGYTPQKSDTGMLPKTLDYVLVQREGENLDSLFTTVFEPYRNTPYITSIEPVEVVLKEGTETTGDMVRAVKVSRINDDETYTDYIVYATNADVVYTVNDSDENGNAVFDFSGFAGVYTLNKNNAVIYRYVNDGTLIGEETGGNGKYTGTVLSFQKELAFDNYIDVNIDCEDLSELADKYIYVNNDGIQNGVYRILSATDEAEGLAEGAVRLDIGTVSIIRGHKDKYNTERGYVYNIKEEQTFSVPISFVEESLPEFKAIPDSLSTSAGSSISVNISAASPIETDTPSITYIGTTLPRGASLNSETGVLTWKPDNSQVGDNHIAITARDSDGRESTIHFMITVYGSTTGSKNETTDNTDTSPAGGGGGGGAAPETPSVGEGALDEDKTDGENSVPDVLGETEKLRFTDLTKHSWASDAINALAADGIIKGTSESTFSPASNITRADFALLLVRAFDLTSDNAENFADVSASDYFAEELAIARNTGIVGGIGDNKFAPRNNITRQDMMVIVYRALQDSLVISMTDEVSYPDFANVADYAKDAVFALIGAGIVNGKNGLISPTDYTTRAEVAVLVKRILDYVVK